MEPLSDFRSFSKEATNKILNRNQKEARVHFIPDWRAGYSWLSALPL